MRDDAVVKKFDPVPIACRAGPVDAGRAKTHEQAGPAARLQLVISDCALSRHAVFRQTVGMRATANAVFDRAWTDPDGRKERRKSVGHGVSKIERRSYRRLSASYS